MGRRVWTGWVGVWYVGFPVSKGSIRDQLGAQEGWGVGVVGWDNRGTPSALLLRPHSSTLDPGSGRQPCRDVVRLPMLHTCLVTAGFCLLA